MMNFPDAPTIGQVFSLYKWDGEKWTCATDPLTMGDPPSNTNPLVNGVVLPGLEYKYARGDHVHPTDTSRAKPNNETLTGTTNLAAANITGNIAITGTFTSTAKGHQFGSPSGNTSPPLKSEANIILYDAGGDNWCGIGSDGGGNVWFRTGLSGTPGPAIFTDQARNTTFLKNPIATTPPVGTNNTQFATTNFVLSNPASGPFLPLAGGTVTGLMYINGDLRVYNSAEVGTVRMNNTGDRYLHYNGNYHTGGGHAYSAAGRLYGNGDFSNPIYSIRHALISDQTLAQAAGLTEIYGGCVTTGCSGPAPAGMIHRYRQVQIILAGTWYAIGYV